MELTEVIRRPLVTEKSTAARDELNQYIFEVDRKATKVEIQKAVESLFKVKVMDVRTANVQGKKRRLGKHAGKRRDWKKAFVTVAPGSSIEIYEGV